MSANGNSNARSSELERRRAALEKLRKATTEEVRAVAVEAGIYTQ